MPASERNRDRGSRSRQSGPYSSAFASARTSPSSDQRRMLTIGPKISSRAIRGFLIVAAALITARPLRSSLRISAKVALFRGVPPLDPLPMVQLQGFVQELANSCERGIGCHRRFPRCVPAQLLQARLQRSRRAEDYRRRVRDLRESHLSQCNGCRPGHAGYLENRCGQ
jgi:hypothetical protein